MSSRSASRNKRQERRRRLERDQRRDEKLRIEESRRSKMRIGNASADDQNHTSPSVNGNDDHSNSIIKSTKSNVRIDSSSISLAMSRRVKQRAEKLRMQHEDLARPRPAKKVKIEHLTIKILAFLVTGATLMALALPALI